jgi:hypothetical protein
MWIFTPFILGGILLLTFILGSIGVLCTHDRRDLVPGLLFGLPTVFVSLLFYVRSIGVAEDFDAVGYLFGIFTFPSLIMGSLVIWRGFRTGQKRRDYFSALLVCASIYLIGFVLVQYPEISDVIFSHIIPAAPFL